MPNIDHENIGNVAKSKYFRGTIVSTDSEDDTAIVSVPGFGDVSAVIFYHCKADAVERENGALEDAAGAFAEDDEVIVLKQDKKYKVIGFADGEKRECGGHWRFQFTVNDVVLDMNVYNDLKTFLNAANPGIFDDFTLYAPSPITFLSIFTQDAINEDFIIGARYDTSQNPPEYEDKGLFIGVTFILSGNLSQKLQDIFEYDKVKNIHIFPDHNDDPSINALVPEGNTGFLVSMNANFLTRRNSDQEFFNISVFMLFENSELQNPGEIFKWEVDEGPP